MHDDFNVIRKAVEIITELNRIAGYDKGDFWEKFVIAVQYTDFQ